ncbi:Esa1p-associated factor [Ascosphaera acerosa]|nr:Esa1p-associated factor [Ascosphaera acerosa]
MAPASSAYHKDEKVFCFHHDILYEAKILDVRHQDPDDKKSPYEYLVHYKGWKNTWDDWVTTDRLRKLTDENRELALNLRREVEALNRAKASSKPAGKKRKLDEHGHAQGQHAHAHAHAGHLRASEERGGGLAGPMSRKRGREQHADVEREENYLSHPSVRIAIPDNLKSLLVDDWENITKNRLLVPLPAEYSANRILDTYLEHERESRTGRPAAGTTARDATTTTTTTTTTTAATTTTATTTTMTATTDGTAGSTPAAATKAPMTATDATAAATVSAPVNPSTTHKNDDTRSVASEQTAATTTATASDAPSSGLPDLVRIDLDVLEEVVAGLREYFDKCLGRILLYKFERPQYHQLRKKWEAGLDGLADKGPGDVYGAEHLARLLVTLPDLIAQTNLGMQATTRLREELTKFSMWLSRNSDRYFSTKYRLPSKEYAAGYAAAGELDAVPGPGKGAP